MEIYLHVEMYSHNKLLIVSLQFSTSRYYKTFQLIFILLEDLLNVIWRL